MGVMKRSAMRKKLLPPIHPVEILLEEFMKPLNLSANALAQRLDVRTGAPTILRTNGVGSRVIRHCD
jgi:hypothetical protein